jgi:hypothetical protein
MSASVSVRPRCRRGHFLGLTRVSEKHDNVIGRVLVWGCRPCQMVTSDPPPRCAVPSGGGMNAQRFSKSRPFTFDEWSRIVSDPHER